MKNMAYSARIDGLVRVFAKGEHGLVWLKRAVLLLTELEITAQSLHNLWSKRYQPAFGKFCMVNQQKLTGKVNIFYTQMGHFTNPQTQSIEQSKDHHVGLTAIKRPKVVRQLRCNL